MKSKDIITTRKRLDGEITRYWKIIKSENIIPKGMDRHYDMKNLLSKINQLADERIQIKLYLQCINMGLKKFSDLPEDNNYKNIFLLSEKREQLVQLGYIKTIDPKLKRAKGKKGLNYSEELTSAYITKLKSSLQLEINKLEKDIEDFNEKLEFEVETPMLSLVA